MLDSCENIYLVGLMGAGKTTLGKKLANRLGRDFVDTDQQIEKEMGVTINHIFDIEGEAGFRLRETTALGSIASRGGQVVATGGGIVTQADNRKILTQSGITIYLHAQAKLLWSRLRYCKNRPLLQTENPQQVLRDLLTKREPLYRQVADHVIHVSSGSPAKTVTKIIQLIDSA